MRRPGVLGARVGGVLRGRRRRSLPSVRQSSALVVGPIDFVRRAEAASETPKNNLERAAANPAARSRRAAQGEHLNKHSNSNPPRSRPAPAAAAARLTPRHT